MSDGEERKTSHRRAGTARRSGRGFRRPPGAARIALLLCAAAISWAGCAGGGARESRPVPRVSVEVEKPVRGELDRLMLDLSAKNWHRRFEAALELRKRGVDAGREVIREGMRAREWFVRADALRYAAECRFTDLAADAAGLLSDPSPQVARAADETLAALLHAYPNPLQKDRAGAWRSLLAEGIPKGGAEALRRAVIRVRKGVRSERPADRLEALMVLRGLDVPGKERMCAGLADDPDDRVALQAVRLLSFLCGDGRHNDRVRPLLKRKDPLLRGYAALYLAERGEGEAMKWELVRALLVPELALRAHRLLLDVYGGEGPLLKKPAAEYEPAELAALWERFVLSDEILKRKRDWEEAPPPLTPGKAPAPEPKGR